MSAAARAPAVEELAPWAAEIRAFEVADRASPPTRNRVVFVGSSSIKMWDLNESFPGVASINRGFGGSQLADVALYAGRIVIPYRPRMVVLYAGDNDIAAGKSPVRVARDFARFVSAIRSKLPETPILFLSIKPSPARWSLSGRMREANALIRDQIKKGKHLRYVDVATPLLGKDGKPRPELFQADGLHLNAEGYKLWAAVLVKLLT